MTTPSPSSGFEFPQDQRDILDQRLRAFVAQDTPVTSVRPSRNPNAAPPIIAPVDESAMQPAPRLQAAPTPVVPPENTVPNPEPAPTPHAEPEAVSIALPSRFHYYPFKDLYVKPFRVFHLAKLAKANDTGSMQSIAEAVSSVISAPGYASKNLASELTLADFNAVLYWLRLNSFSKKQMAVTSYCNNPAHQEKVKAGVMPEASLKIKTIFKNSEMKHTDLENVPDPEKFFVVYNDSRIELKPETIKDLVELLDHPDLNDEEFQYKARIASVLSVKNSAGAEIHITEKIKIVDQLSADQAIVAMEFAEMLDAYGVQETVNTKCMECGASGTVQIVVDAPTFLSPEF